VIARPVYTVGLLLDYLRDALGGPDGQVDDWP
jgi:hypothetical protein